jgi:hypothetical protein
LSVENIGTVGYEPEWIDALDLFNQLPFDLSLCFFLAFRLYSTTSYFGGSCHIIKPEAYFNQLTVLERHKLANFHRPGVFIFHVRHTAYRKSSTDFFSTEAGKFFGASYQLSSFF